MSPPGIIIQADPDLLRLVIQGLATNAAKNNLDDGLIRFRLTLQEKNTEVTIADTGAPIPGEARERIFDRFYRIDKSRGDRVPGTGLGPSLAREIVRAHRGTLLLDTGPDGLITLPFHSHFLPGHRYRNLNRYASE